MKKTGVLILTFLLIFSTIAFAFAEDNSTNSTDTNSTSDDETTQQQDTSKIDLGFECLEDKVENNCDELTTQEIVLTILASPNTDVYDECLEELKDRESGDNWGNVRDTALAILALQHSGETTDEYESWLLEQTKTPTDLIWYLQQDSNTKTQCKISYDGDDYTININENKKIDANAGTCLTRAQSNFWLRINPDCFDETFSISCDKDFIANLIYQNKDSSTIYVLDETQSEPSFGTIELQVNSECFSSSSSGNCDYESTAWATLALQSTGHDVEKYIPYIMAMADSNEKYLPNSFIYMVTGYEDYATRLIQEQELGNYWQAISTPYNKYYDTALALIAVGSSSAEKVTKAKDWLLFSQSSTGCWGNSIRDTAIILWALEGRSGKSSSSGGTTYCSEANFFCIPSSDCPENERLENYFCSGLGSVCCKNENLLSCSEYYGEVCSADEVCSGNSRKATDTDECCTGECVPRPETSECEDFGYICKTECSSDQEEVTYSCDGNGVCCRTSTSQKSSWWIWVLILAILIVLGVFAWIYREHLKLYWFKLKSKFKKDKGGSSSSSGSGPRSPPTSGFPSRLGFPPVRRRPLPVGRPFTPQQVSRNTKQNDKPIDDIFKKLKEMSQ